MSLPIAAALFDKDGTLFDFQATWGVFTRGLLEEEAPDPDQRAEMADLLGFDLGTGLFRKDSLVIAGTAAEVHDALAPLLPDGQAADLLARMNARTAEAPQIEVTPLVPFVQAMRDRGLSIGVATNDAEAPARSHLRRAGVEHAFDFIAGYDSGHGGKPAPGQLLAFARAVGVPPAACLMVGDSLHDLHAGAAAGMRPVAVLTGVAEADDLAHAAEVVLPSIAHLPAWIDAQE